MATITPPPASDDETGEGKRGKLNDYVDFGNRQGPSQLLTVTYYRIDTGIIFSRRPTLRYSFRFSAARSSSTTSFFCASAVAYR